MTIVVLVGLGTFAGLWALWMLLAQLLAMDRGLELTDEGLYLLAADPPTSTAAWGFPFGWHTAPLFRIFNYDIANFRTAGAVILVITVALVGWLAASTSSRNIGSTTTMRRRWARPVTAATAAAIGALLYYVPMLRTPSYNWANVIGIAVATVGVLHIAKRTDRDPANSGGALFIAASALSSLGIFITVPAKPTTAPLFLVLGMFYLAIVVGWRSATRWTLTVISLFPAWVLAAVLTGIWPTEFTSVFSLALRMPLPSEYHTIWGAISSALLVPQGFFRGIANQATGVFLVLSVGFTLVAVPVIVRKRWTIVRIIGLGILAIGALAVSGVPIPGLEVEVHTYRLAYAPLTTACLLILAGVALAAFDVQSGAPTRGSVSTESGFSSARAWATITLVAILPFVFAFGSDNGIYAQASLTSGFLLLAAILLAFDARGTRYRRLLVSTTFGLTVIVSAIGIYSGWKAPYRIAPLATQSVTTAIGAHASLLRLDNETAARLNSLRDEAVEAGWATGTPIVDISYTWAPGIPYFLGGRVPDFLQLTIFGYGSTHAITAFHLSEPYLDFPFDSAWLLTTQHLDDDARLAVDATIDALGHVSGRHFPDEFACLEATPVTLWRPVDDKKRLTCGQR